MSKTAHTPGPWEAHYSPTLEGWEVGSFKKADGVRAFISDRATVGKPEITEAEANARLIAAVPALLQACKAVETFAREGFGKNFSAEERLTVITPVSAAIALAKTTY